MSSGSAPSQGDIDRAEAERARLEELRRQAELSRMSRGRSQRRLGVEQVKLGPNGPAQMLGQPRAIVDINPVGRG